MTSKEIVEHRIEMLKKGLILDNSFKDYTGLQIKDYMQVLKDLERLEKQDKLLDALIENANFAAAEYYLIRSNPCILICIDDRNEYFDEILKRVNASLDKRDEAYYSNTLSRYKGPLLSEVLKNDK